MPVHPTNLLSRTAPRRWLAGAVLALGMLQPAAASPADPLMEWLGERGLVGADSSVVQNLRDKASDMVMNAMNFLGVPYKFGGNTAESGFDCSGFTRYVFEHSLGLVLPRRAADQAQSAGLKEVRLDDLKPGDLVFFNTMKRAFSHVGIYVGDNKFIHAPRSGSVVRVDDMRRDYWMQRFNGARRAQQGGDNAPTVELSTAVPRLD